MRAVQTPGISARYRPSVLTRGSRPDRHIPTRHPIRRGRLRRLGSDAWPSASVLLRSVLLVAMAMLLILVLLPAALGAAGPQVARAV